MSIFNLPTLLGSLVATAVFVPESTVLTHGEGILLEVTPIVEEDVLAIDVLFHQESGAYSSPAEDLHLNFDEDSKALTLYDVLVAYGALTDQNFTFTDTVENYLVASTLNLTHSQVIPKDSVQAWVEHLLNENGFLFDPLTSQGPRLIAVVHTQGAGKTPSPIAVPFEDLADWSDNAATVISTIVTLPNLDVRQMANSMRVMVVDARFQSFLPAGNSNSMLLTGRAPWVVATAAMLDAVNDAAQQDHVSRSTQDMQILRFQLEHAHAGSAAELVEDLILSTVVRPNTMNAPMVQPNPVRVLADPRTNALLATVQPDLVERLKQAVALIDVEVAD
tara:strand:+ start:7396 stop:8397 length:1002 start_codon:yes stop_codon:yes gene_type:complete